MIKILIIVPKTLSIYNGLINTTLSMIKGLNSNNNINLFVIGPRVFEELLIKEGIKHYFIGYSIIGGFNPFFPVILRFIIYKYKIDIIHGTCSKTDIYFPFIQKRVKKISIVRGVYSHEYQYLNILQKIKIKLFLYTIKYVSDVILVQSKYAMDDMKKLIHRNNNVYHIPSGVNEYKFRTRENNGFYFKIIISGRLSKEKRVCMGIDIMSKIVRDGFKDIILHIYGDGPQLSNLCRMIDKHCLNDYVKIFGNHDNMHKVYPEYNIMWHFCKHEAFSRAILESMSSSVPVIAYPGGGALDIIKHGYNGFLVKEQNEIDSYYYYTVFLYNNKNQFKRMRLSARKTIIANYSERKYHQEYNRIINKLIS
jgi:glycosyltransferase involved in cell wall biosynthesis